MARIAGSVTALALMAVLLATLPATAQGPMPSFTIEPSAPEAGQQVNFTSTSTPGPSGAALVRWEWSFGDGGYDEGERVSHTFGQPCECPVMLRVTDANGAMAEAPSLLVIPEPPAPPQQPDRTSSALPAWLFWLMPFLVSLVLFSIAYLVVAKGQPAIYNQVFLFFYVTSGLKSLSEAAIALLAGQPAAAGFETFNRFTAYLLVAIFLWFVLVFPRPIVPWLRDGRRGVVVLLLTLPFVAIEFGSLIPVANSVDLFNVFAVAIAVASLGLLLWHSRETDSQEERLRIRWLAGTFLLLVASTVALTILNLLYSGAIGEGQHAQARTLANLTALTGLIVVPALEIVGALILLYAILRYQVLGIEGLVLRLTRGAVVALTVPSIFIVVSNSIEQLFESTVLADVKFAFLIAGFVSTLLMFPVQKWITFLLHRWLPTLDRESEQESVRRREIFEAQLRYCLLDGALKPKEVQTLRKLAARLAMPASELQDVTKRFPGVDASALGSVKTRAGT